MTINFNFQRLRRCSVRSTLFLGLVTLSNGSFCSVVLDGSMGGLPNQIVSAGNGATYNITANLGQTRGANLFHSFSTFDVGGSEIANFSGPSSISNIIARVTSGQNSTIAGQVRASIDQANLWLINPAGIIFGNGAVVDVSGSFNLSTSDFVNFVDGSRFYSQLSPASTLSTAAISSFGFLGASHGAVSFNSDPDVVASVVEASQNVYVGAQTIALDQVNIFAQEVEVSMGAKTVGSITLNQASLQAVEGKVIFLGGQVSAVDSFISAAGKDSGIDIQSNAILLRGASGTSVISSGNLQASGGDILLQADEIQLSNNAQLISSSGGERSGGNIGLISKNILVDSGSVIELASGEGSRAGNLTIDTDNFLLRNNSSLNTSSEFARATAGSITIDATSRFGIENNSQLLATSVISGDGGKVSVSADTIVLRSQSAIDVKTEGAGNANLVDLVATTSITIDQQSTLNASTSGIGNGGDVRLTAPIINIDDSDIVGAVSGLGAGGDIFLIGDAVNISGGSTFNVSSLAPGAVGGNAGLIDIKSGSVSVSGGSRFQLVSVGAGQAGRLKLEATSINFTDSAIEAEARNKGLGGDIVMLADVIDWDGVQVDASVAGEGSGGFLSLLGGTVELKNSFVNITAAGLGGGGRFRSVADSFTSSTTAIVSNTSGAGAGGSVAIEATSINLLAGTTLTAGSTGRGNAGAVTLAAGTFNMVAASILTDARGAGDGGRVKIDADVFSMTEDAAIRSNSFDTGVGGDIKLNAADMHLSAAIVHALGFGLGDAGQISLVATDLVVTDESSINVSAFIGESQGGRITLEADTIAIDHSDFLSDTASAGLGGDIVITGTLIDLLAGTSLKAQTLGRGNAGNIFVTADTLNVAGAALITNSRGEGNGGGVAIDATNFTMTDLATIRSDALGTGSGGNVSITATELSMSNAGINALTNGDGDGGVVNLEATNLSLTAGVSLNVSSNVGSGDAGRIDLTAENIVIDQSRLLSNTSALGRGGNITLTGTNIELRADASLNAETFGSGDAGGIVLVGESVSLVGSSVNTTSTGAGNGGRVGIDAASVTLADAAAIRSDALGAGSGGNVTVVATELSVSDSGIDALTRGDGSGGVVALTAANLTLKEDAVVNVSSLGGTGDAGRIEIAADTLLIDHSRLSSDTTGPGLGGDLTLTSTSMSLLNEALISSSASGVANAGRVNLIAADRFTAVDATVQTVALKSGGGSILISAVERIEIDNSVVSASASGVKSGDDGGNVTIDPVLFTLRQSQIVAQANVGDGGNILLVAENFVADTQTLISASSQQGIDGLVAIESPNQAVNPTSANLNTGFQDLSEFISRRCSTEKLEGRSYLVVENMNPVRQNPNDYLTLGPRLARSATAANDGMTPWQPGC
ncbi:MAG: filamentous hemagglutinin N-terminal domain-containing protein [SAR86 cluster bacterium]